MSSLPLIISGSSHPSLASDLAMCLGGELGRVETGLFPDGETMVQVLADVQGRDVIVLQSTAFRPNDYLMELWMLLNICKRAQSLTVIIPYLGYSRQDGDDLSRPVISKILADFFEKAGAEHIVAVDLHTPAATHDFTIPVTPLSAAPILVGGILQEGVDVSNLMVVAPDKGALKLAEHYAKLIDAPVGWVEKERLSCRNVVARQIFGDIRGKEILIVDDICSTAHTLTSAAHVCKQQGAGRIYGAVTHGLFVEDALDLIESAPIETLWVTDTVPQLHGSDKRASKIRVLSVAALLAQSCHSVLEKPALSSFFEESCP